jgi:hypothetical protein
VVPFDVPLQIVGLDVAGFTTLRGAHVRTVVVVYHRVTGQTLQHLERLTTTRDIAMIRALTSVGSHVIHQGVPFRESGPAVRDIAMERPLTCVGSLVVHEDVLLRKGGPAFRDIALVWPFARMSPFVLSGMGRRHFFAALPEPA